MKKGKWIVKFFEFRRGRMYRRIVKNYFKKEAKMTDKELHDFLDRMQDEDEVIEYWLSI